MVRNTVFAQSANEDADDLAFRGFFHFCPIFINTYNYTGFQSFRIDDIDAMTSPHDQSQFSFRLLNLPLYAVCRLRSELAKL